MVERILKIGWCQNQHQILYAVLCKSTFDKLSLETEEISLEDDRFGDALEIISKGNTIARLGKVSPKLLKEYDIDQDCFTQKLR